jgi:hypothetical protein
MTKFGGEKIQQENMKGMRDMKNSGKDFCAGRLTLRPI